MRRLQLFSVLLGGGWAVVSASAAELPKEPRVDLPRALRDKQNTVLSPSAHIPGVRWRYRTADPGRNWFEPGYDDHGWLEGESGFGARTPPGGIVRTEWNSREIWLRRTFILTNSAPPRLQLLMHHDDDVEIYLNGVAAGAAREYTVTYQEYRVSEEAVRALKPGTNLLAVHCRQDFGAQYIDVALLGRTAAPRRENFVLESESGTEPATTAARPDWPQFLGPSRNAVYSGPSLREDWPASGLPLVWAAPIGEGYSSPVVGEGKLILCHRLGDESVVNCFDPLTGAVEWSFRDPMSFKDGAGYDSGPRPTPAIRNGRVFVFNTDGHLTCLKLSDGTVAWRHRCRSEFGGRGTWSGFVASPLALSNAVIVAVGGMAAAVMAFAPDTGALLWQQHDDEATAASPLLATLAGRPQLLVITRTFLRGLDPVTGDGLWQYATHRQGSGSVFGASPVVLGDYIFLSGWYGLGARLLRISAAGPERLWSRNDALSTLYANAIVHRGYAYGFHGHPFEGGGPSLRCIDLETGEVLWEQRGSAAGTLIRCGDQLLILFDSGQLQLIAADPDGYKIKATTQLFGRFTRSYPAIVDGLVYVRGPKKLVCVDLRRPR